MQEFKNTVAKVTAVPDLFKLYTGHSSTRREVIGIVIHNDNGRVVNFRPMVNCNFIRSEFRIRINTFIYKVYIYGKIYMKLLEFFTQA